MTDCMRCGSGAINPRMHGRDGADLDLCDVCYWRKRADSVNQWQPIDTVPKDGTHVLLANNNQTDCGYVLTGQFDYLFETIGCIHAPTNWMPLPRPPEDTP